MKSKLFSLFAVLLTVLFLLNSCGDKDDSLGYFFRGDWQITDSCDHLHFKPHYDMRILGDTTGQSDDIITLKYLYTYDSLGNGFPFIVTATVRGDSCFFIPQQVQGQTITGKGVIKSISSIRFEWEGGLGGSCTSIGSPL